jgi:hypothetical protein
VARPIFISHASADAPLVGEFVKNIIRLGCGVQPDSLLYSSASATGVPGGADLNRFLRDEVSSAKLVIAIVTPTYLSRPYCVAELGAAWGRVEALDSLLPLRLPDTDVRDLHGVLSGLVIGSIVDDGALNEVHRRVCAATGTLTDAVTWGDAKRDWLREFAETTAAMRFGGPVTACCASSRDAGHMEIFWADTSGNVFHRWWDDRGWSEARPLEGPKATHIAAVSRADGDQWLFGVHDVGQLWARRWVPDDRGRMVAGTVEWIPGEVTGPLGAVSKGEWQAELTAWTVDGRQCHLYRSEQRWTGWTTDWWHRT